LVYQNPTTIAPAPVVASTDKLIDNPGILPNDTWGFAIEDQLNFDATYATNDANNTYAKLLTTDQTIYQTDKALGETPAPLSTFTAYYGAKLTLATVAGDYKTTITYTAIGEEVPEPPGVACVSGEQFKGNVGNMQNIDTSAWVDGDTGIATDTRNNQKYCIGKLKDEKVWMLDNLKLELYDGMTLTSATTNVLETEPKTVTLATGGRLDGSNFTTSDYLTIDGTYSGGTDYDNFNAWRQVDPGDINTTLGNDVVRNCDPQGLKLNCGYLYNFYTATASSVDNSKTDDMASQSICPAGWKLPSGGSSSGDFGQLDLAYPPGTGSNHGGLDAQGLWLLTGAWRGVFSGRYDGFFSGQRPPQSQSYSVYWSSVYGPASFASGASVFGNDIVSPTGADVGRRYVGFAVRCLVVS
jgi:hypothetical protein